MLPLDVLVSELDDLLAALDQAEQEHAEAIERVDPAHRAGAANLVHYTCLRQRDIRELQNDLLDLGATSLATTEADVRAKVLAARNVVRALRGEERRWDLDGINEALDGGDAILAENARTALGAVERDDPTRIMVTLPSEAAEDPELVLSFAEAGMDIARINTAHDDRDAWARMARNVRAAGERTGRTLLISMDLPGPKLRTGPIASGPAVARARITHDEAGNLLAPARIWLTDPAAPGAAPPPPASAKRPTLTVHVDPAWLAERKEHDVLELTDARGRTREFRIVEAAETGVLAECDRNSYVIDGSTIVCAGSKATISGIPPLPQRLSLNIADELVLTADLTPVAVPPPGGTATIGCTLPDAITALTQGDQVLFDDGAIRARVEAVEGEQAFLRIEHTKPGGQRLGAEKGINLPDTVLPVPALTPQDADNLPFVAEHSDLVAVSFIRTADDVEQVLQELSRIGAQDLGLILKIETRQGFENLPSILLAAMRHQALAVMIARGDLAVEVGFERLSEVPRQILALCEAAHVPVIWATQVLESMAKTGQPSRAEITDAAAAQRAECVMLNKGPHIVEAIQALGEIVNRVGEVQVKSRTLLRRIHSWDGQ